MFCINCINQLNIVDGFVSFWDSNLSRYGHGGKPTEVGISHVHETIFPPIDGKETFHMDPISPENLAEKASHNSSHACQIVSSKRNNNWSLFRLRY